MNDNDIIKVVEHCAGSGKCIDCPANNYNCTGRLMKCILNLIKRLKAEIERLQGYNENLQTANVALSNEILDIRSDAIKEFAERVKATFPAREDERCTLDDCYTLDIIDNLVEEMTGEAE